MVSIIMPAYNAEKTIKESIESVINQTYTNWELIIINDCSTDNTEQVIKSFNDNRIKYIKNSKNLKVAKTRNRGMEIAKFDYISFLDSDDLWLPNKLEEQINFMLDNQIAFSITNYEIITNDGNKTGKYIQSKTRNYKQLLRGNKVGCLTVMLDKRKLRDVKFKDIGHEDYALWLELLRSNNIKVHSIDKVLAKHRDTDSSLSSDKTKAIKWVWNIFRNEENKNVFFSIYLMVRYGLNYFNKTKRVIR